MALIRTPDRRSIAAGVDPTASWEECVRAYRSQVYRLALRLTRSQQDAEDLTQDVFVRVFRHITSYTPRNIDGWLYQITMNLFRDRVRRVRRIRMEPLPSDTVNRDAAMQPGVDQLVTGPVFDDDIQNALAALHPDVRTAVLLRDVDGLTYQEISDVLGVNRNTIAARLHRGRSQLRSALMQRAPSSYHAGAAAASATAAT